MLDLHFTLPKIKVNLSIQGMHASHSAGKRERVEGGEEQSRQPEHDGTRQVCRFLDRIFLAANLFNKFFDRSRNE